VAETPVWPVSIRFTRIKEPSVEHSDLSDMPIEGDAPASVVVHLDDGRRRLLRVTTEEAAALAEKGRDVTRRWQRMTAWLRHRIGKVVIWALGLLIVSLAIPAATKQWSDRQAALALKAELIGEISRGSISAFTGAKRIAAEKDLDNANAERLKTRDAWEDSEAGVDAQYAVYFRETTARDVWLEYRNVVYDYISLGCCDEHRDEDIRILHEYLGNPKPWPTQDDPWEIARCGDQESCAATTDFSEAYTWLGIKLLAKRGDLLSELRLAQPSGISLGWRDFLRDTFKPFAP
jgi:hypothetical protein